MNDLHLHPAISTSPAQTTSAVPSPKLVNAAHEFEASMMKELLAPLNSEHDLLGSDGDDEGSSSALTSFAGEALGKAISEHGGLGIATSILHQLASRSNQSGNAPVPSNLIGTTTKSSHK